MTNLENPFPYDNKILNKEHLEEKASLCRPLVMTNGCFDILHLGHIDYLYRARSMGDALLVAVNSNYSVQLQNKGKDRPIFDLIYRMRMLASLDCVDYVTWFDEETPSDLIQKLCPDVLVKGSDWPLELVAGAQEVRAYGGRVELIDFIYDVSTTKILERIRSHV
jgi:rfaE bifunctional protein nucleotidyltransferase chain/domain